MGPWRYVTGDGRDMTQPAAASWLWCRNGPFPCPGANSHPPPCPPPRSPPVLPRHLVFPPRGVGGGGGAQTARSDAPNGRARRRCLGLFHCRPRAKDRRLLLSYTPTRWRAEPRGAQCSTLTRFRAAVWPVACRTHQSGLSRGVFLHNEFESARTTRTVRTPPERLRARAHATRGPA